MKRFLEVSDNPIYLIELLAGYIAAFLWGGFNDWQIRCHVHRQ